jgi:hypothetical protein
VEAASAPRAVSRLRRQGIGREGTPNAALWPPVTSPASQKPCKSSLFLARPARPNPSKPPEPVSTAPRPSERLPLRATRLLRVAGFLGKASGLEACADGLRRGGGLLLCHLSYRLKKHRKCGSEALK